MEIFLNNYSEILSKVTDYIANSKALSPLYLDNDDFQCYLRKYRDESSFVITRFYILNEKFRGNGYGTKLINDIHHIKSDFDKTIIDCIGNPRLVNWLIRHGWLITDETKTHRCPSLYKSKPRS